MTDMEHAMPQYPFDRVKIDRFRGLQELELRRLGRINVLVGANNSGKTSVLEALAILCDPLDPYEWLSLVARRDFGGLDENRIQSLQWCFRQKGVLVDPHLHFVADCEMQSEGVFPLRSIAIHYQDILGEPSSEELKKLTRSSRVQEKKMEHALDRGWRGAEITHVAAFDSGEAQRTSANGRYSTKTAAMRIWEGLPTRHIAARNRPRVESETLTPYSYQINRLQVRQQSERLLDDDRRHLTLDLIRLFEADVSDITIASFWGERPAIYLKDRRLGIAPLSIFGDALRRAVLLASTIAALGTGGLLLIDEAETGIHVDAMKDVFSWLIRVARDFRVQVVVTTHSLDAVDAIVASAGQELDDLVTFHLDQTPEETKVHRIAGDLLFRLRHERGLDVRRT